MVTFANRVAETTLGTGTGVLPLGGAVPGYQTFFPAFTVGSEVGYTIVDDATGDFECGTGTLISAAQIRRDQVSSSTTGGFVNFGAGVKIVAAVTLAEDQTMDQGTF